MMATPVVLRPEDGVSGGPGKIVELGHPVLCCTVSILCYESILGGAYLIRGARILGSNI